MAWFREGCSVFAVAVGNVPMAAQVGWISGYAKRCRGWFDPGAFIEKRLEAK